MDHWGIAGCREHFAEIREWLNEAAAKANWLDKVKAAASAVVAGIFIDPLDAAGSLVRLAIARAESKASTAPASQAPIPPQ